MKTFSESEVNAVKIKETRLLLGLTQEQAAEKIGVSVRAWQYWEAGERKMHPAFWELFLAKKEEPGSSSKNKDTALGFI